MAGLNIVFRNMMVLLWRRVAAGAEIAQGRGKGSHALVKAIYHLARWRVLSSVPGLTAMGETFHANCDVVRATQSKHRDDV